MDESKKKDRYEAAISMYYLKHRQRHHSATHL